MVVVCDFVYLEIKRMSFVTNQVKEVIYCCVANGYVVYYFLEISTIVIGKSKSAN